MSGPTVSETPAERRIFSEADGAISLRLPAGHSVIREDSLVAAGTMWSRSGRGSLFPKGGGTSQTTGRRKLPMAAKVEVGYFERTCASRRTSHTGSAKGLCSRILSQRIKCGFEWIAIIEGGRQLCNSASRHVLGRRGRLGRNHAEGDCGAPTDCL